jgi:GT2 family glycosyltransferase
VAALTLSIVVVAYRQRSALFECLDSCLVAADRVAGGAELIVVDNGSLAGTIRARYERARLIEPGANVGFAGGVQRGIDVASGRWIALVNDDARVEPGTFAALLAAGERSPSIGSVAAQVRFSNAPERINSAGLDVDGLGIATERLAGAGLGAADRAGEVFGAPASCALYRREMLVAIGGFDARFFAYLEDVDLAWRARAAGWTCWYEPLAVAYHQGSASSGHASARKYFLVGRNRVWLLARNATRRQLLRALPGVLAYDGAYVIFVALGDHTLAPLRGRITGLRSWRRLRRETRAERREVDLRGRGWVAALRQHRAYGDLGGGS